MFKLRTGNVFKRNQESKKKIKINRGGTRSGKTYGILQLFAVWLITGYLDSDVNDENTSPRLGKVGERKYWSRGIASVVRKEKSDLAQTVIRDFEEILADMGALFLLSKEHRNKTLREYVYQGRKLEFMGADDEQKLRGKGRDILYCNEANALSYDEEFFQLLVRTNDKVFVDFNPDNEDIWINTELEQRRSNEVGDVDIIVSTYKDNPFLPEGLIKEIEYLGKTNPTYWRIYGLGEYGKLEGLVFDNWRIVGDLNLDDLELIGYGIDFGFKNDPATVIGGYKLDKMIILHEFVYETGLTNQDIDAKITSMGLDKMARYVGDGAEPKSVEELFRSGYNIISSSKGPGSVKYGIDVMLQYKIGITPQSQNLIREFKGYCYIKSKNGRDPNIPQDKLNHGIDAARYLFMDILHQGRRIKNMKPILCDWT